MRLNDIVQRVKAYQPGADTALIEKAYVFSAKSHDGQMRKSGDPYFVHPVSVASIITEMKLDVSSICAALLHDTVEDCGVTDAQIKQEFGEEIAFLVDGVTKLSQLEVFSERTKQAENFRKLMLAQTKLVESGDTFELPQKPEAFRLRSAGVILPRDVDFQEGAREVMTV